LGCLEKYDLEFQWWVIYKGRTKKRKKQMFKNFNANTKEKLIFKNQRSLDKWLKENLV
jgi:hypothetical protein